MTNLYNIPNLIAIYYQNIGPFEKQCSILFDEGKYLIKAKIGSGKSFLFFDGPIYALYGSTGDLKTTGSKGRDILNKKSTKGEISLLFEVDGMYYIIKRTLARKKTTSSTDTFFKVMYQGENIIEDIKKKIQKSDILLWDYNIIEEIERATDLFTIEQQPFKNNSDVQSFLDANILLEKNVFLNTIFLLQDSKNIFECPAQERITILKNVFGLIGVDAWKETLQTEKKDLETEKRILGDDSRINENLKNNLKQLIKEYQSLKAISFLQTDFTTTESFFEELEVFIEKIWIDHFNISNLDKKIFQNFKQQIENEIEKQQKIQTENQMLIKQSQETNQEIQKIELQKQDIQKKIEETKEKTKEIDETLLDNLTKEKKQISETLEKKNQIVDYNLINKVVQQNIFDINTENTEITTLDETRKYLEECIRKGKSLNEKITFNQQSKEQIKKQEEYRNKSHEKELENITTNYERLKKDVEEAEERLLQFSKQIQEEKNFSCDKIQGTCPYITIINKQHFESREEEQKKYQEEVTKKKQILEDFNYEQKIKEKKEEKSDENFKEKLENIEKEIQQDSTTCERMKKFFETIQYPTIKKEIEEEKRLINILQEKDKQFNELFEKKQNIEKYEKEIVTLENNIKNLDEQKEIQKKKNAELTDKIQWLNAELQKFEEWNLKEHKLSIENFLKHYDIISTLVDEFQSKQKRLKTIEQRLEKVKKLYNILNSELIVYSFQNFLPILTDTINNALSKVVSFEITMKPEQKDNGELILNILFNDEHGEREATSLSGGQKTILKLVWMLSISIYLHTPLLFLDETINNLDEDAVSKVATLINEFVKQNDIKFYTITHNNEIQAMNIRDKTIQF